MFRLSLRAIFPLLALTFPLAGLVPADDAGPSPARHHVWSPDNGDDTYTNPIIFADYSDPDAVRVGEDVYLVSSSFNCFPGLPVLHSEDLVNWTLVGHAVPRYPFEQFNTPQHGNGIWAPAIRHRNGEYYVYWGDPDLGIFMAKTKDPAGEWEPPVRVWEGQGRIDPCPFWDDDGQAYLVHAWAKSRAGFNSVLTLCRMSADGTRLLDEGRQVFDGTQHHPTIEGPKMYKRNGYYYIFAPAGGVKPGWQTVLRSKNIDGPYEDRIVLAQGSTDVNGPHQGALVELPSGESWFLHFQDRGAYGRVVHLQPVEWKDDWPVIGSDTGGDGTGQPVSTHRKPDVGRSHPIAVPQTTDEFNTDRLGLAWQWHANPRDDWASLAERPGWLRLRAVAMPEGASNLWSVPNLLLQKLPGPEFTVTVRLDPERLADGERAGLVVMGVDYACLAIEKTARGTRLLRVTCRDARGGGKETLDYSHLVGPNVFLRVDVQPGAVCRFSYSQPGTRQGRPPGARGEDYALVGGPFEAQPGRWIGTKVGLFCLASEGTEPSGSADFDWFRIE